jgi:serine/threonine-protein kinase
MLPSPAEGPALVGRYRISGRLASSAIDEVYKGFDPLLERPVVVRVIRLRLPDPAAESVIKETFYNEMQRAGALAHHGIATLYDAGEISGGLFTAEEFFEAASLASLLADGLERDILPRVSLLSQMADALEYARELGVPHLHLRPSSVLVSADRTLKLGGFGVARLVDALTSASRDAGGPRPSRYLAPERARREPGDHRSDVYSLAMIALDLLADPDALRLSASDSDEAIPPFCKELAALGVNPTRWAVVFERALSPDPADRFETPGELEIELLLMLGIGVAEARTAREAAEGRIYLAPVAMARTTRTPPQDEPTSELSTESGTTRTGRRSFDSDISYRETMMADSPETPSDG